MNDDDNCRQATTNLFEAIERLTSGVAARLFHPLLLLNRQISTTRRKERPQTNLQLLADREQLRGALAHRQLLTRISGLFGERDTDADAETSKSARQRTEVRGTTRALFERDARGTKAKLVDEIHRKRGEANAACNDTGSRGARRRRQTIVFFTKAGEEAGADECVERDEEEDDRDAKRDVGNVFGTRFLDERQPRR